MLLIIDLFWCARCVWCTVHSAQCTVHSVHCTVQLCVVYSAQCTVQLCVVYSAQCTVYSAVHSVQCTVYSAVGCGVQCTVYSAVVLYQLPATRSAPHSSQNAVGTDHMCPSATDPVSATKHFVRIFLQIRRGVLFKMSSKKGTLPENRFSDSHISLKSVQRQPHLT